MLPVHRALARIVAPFPCLIGSLSLLESATCSLSPIRARAIPRLLAAHPSARASALCPHRFAAPRHHDAVDSSRPSHGVP
ncbi:hypothetical protein M0R45_015908 [Rubus argutus]|uniref:Secreted protein n=1 Tax=Rubus argutus TaxID=59490 RepID=A0AAW1XRH5_RUBAR